MGEYTTNIGIKNELYEELKKRKSPGQSFSGVIRELLQKAEKYEEQQG
jgi:predicted CopG family antitoxin